MANDIVPRQANTGFALIGQGELPTKISINTKEERITTVIAEKSTMRGDFLFEEGLKVDGMVQGSVEFGTVDGLCVVSRRATIDGDLRGPRALVMGTVTGNLQIEGTLVLSPSAVIQGNISYGRLVVYDGATIGGTLNRNTVTPQISGAHQEADVVQLQRQVAAG